MNINDLTLGQIKELNPMLGTNAPTTVTRHPLEGQRVIAVLPHGFIHFGTLQTIENGYILKNASNLRRWESRTNGLPEFAQNGPDNRDKIDSINEIYIHSVIFFYPTGSWA